jgi:hypothetical protein
MKELKEKANNARKEFEHKLKVYNMFNFCLVWSVHIVF